MKQIRRNVFETNSSSVHTLQISKDGLEPSELKLNKDGNIEIELGEFGKNYMIYNTQYEKLQYLISFIAYGCYYYDLQELYKNYDFMTVRNAVCEYTGANDIIVVGEAEAHIDHQSADECVINLWNPDAIINFVFNKYVALETDCD